jgi:hypothetical protein
VDSPPESIIISTLFFASGVFFLFSIVKNNIFPKKINH